MHAVYRRFEVDPGRTLLTSLLLLGIPSASTYLFSTIHTPLVEAAFISFSVFYAALISSVVLYRISPFHPLAKYPGPFVCKVSMIHMAFVTVRGKRHEYIRSLFDKYGDIVRIGEMFSRIFPTTVLLNDIHPGPNEVCIRDPSAIVPLLGPSGFPKGPSEYQFPI